MNDTKIIITAAVAVMIFIACITSLALYANYTAKQKYEMCVSKGMQYVDGHCLK